MQLLHLFELVGAPRLAAPNAIPSLLNRTIMSLEEII